MIDHSLGCNHEYESCNLDRFGESLFFAFRSGVPLAAHGERRQYVYDGKETIHFTEYIFRAGILQHNPVDFGQDL